MLILSDGLLSGSFGVLVSGSVRPSMPGEYGVRQSYATIEALKLQIIAYVLAPGFWRKAINFGGLGAAPPRQCDRFS